MGSPMTRTGAEPVRVKLTEAEFMNGVIALAMEEAALIAESIPRRTQDVGEHARDIAAAIRQRAERLTPAALAQERPHAK